MAIRPTFMGFETATRGLMANQKSLDIVANNTSNIGVTGYTRQRVDLVSLHMNQRNTMYSRNNTPLAGQGVGIQRQMVTAGDRKKADTARTCAPNATRRMKYVA